MEIDTSLYDYWKKNFSNKNIISISNNLQKNIARTKNGLPISDADWNRTLNYIQNIIELRKQDSILEWCCGNGVLIGELAVRCKKAIGVDYSVELIEQLHNNYNNVETHIEDALDYKIYANSINKIILYFSIQHFSERDAFKLIIKSINGLKKGGKMFIGDIPDIDNLWNYLNKEEYRKDYFNRLLQNRPKIGNWFKKDFFLAMNSYFDNVKFKIIDQPDYQINSDHCFDLLIEKNA